MPNMYQEYLDNYNEQSKKFGPKVAIFLMVGIFYEMYDVLDPVTGTGKTTFAQLVDFLGLKVSVKKGEGPNGLDGLVAGIPDYSVHKWAARLTQLGWTVVLVEQVKNIQGKVTSRKVDRILTPGTHVEAATASDLYITFVHIEEASSPWLALTAIDLTTGHLHVFETQAQGSEEAWTSNDSIQFMELYPPREVLWSVNGSKRFTDTLQESKLKNILGCPNGTTFHQRESLTSGAWLNPFFREDFLQTQCNLKSLLPTHTALHLSPGSRAETALLSLLNSLKDIWPSMKLGQLLVYPWTPGTTMRLGENALVQLHMIVQDDGKQDVLGLMDKCSSPMGHRGLRERLLKPSANISVIKKNLDAVDIWTKKESDPVVKRLRTMSDLHRIYRKLQQGTLQSTDLINFDTTLKAIQWIANSESSHINESSLIHESVFKVFNVDKVYLGSDDLSYFHKGIVPGLDLIEEDIQKQKDSLDKWILDRATSINVARDIFKIEYRDSSLIVKGPRAAIQALGASGKLPPNVTAKLNKTGSHLEGSELDRIFIILERLRDSLKKVQSAALLEHGTFLADKLFHGWMELTDWITNIDVNLTLAIFAKENGYSKPILLDSENGSIDIKGLRHPLLEAQDRKIPYVQHDVKIGIETQGWLLYGLNASGKSSLMRAIGLATLLAQGGSFVPCSSMTLSPFQSLHTRIINTDNLWMGLSSFAVEMSEMRDIFREAGPKSLVLGDELCSGTETSSATALVAAGLKGLMKRGARFLFATHLHSLSKIEEVTNNSGLKIWHLHVEYDKIKDRLVYHRTLREGSGSSLYGLEVAKAMRIPDDILEDAIRFRKRLVGESELSESVGSSWNSKIIRIKCEICGTSESSELEVHHIKPRKLADKLGHLTDLSNVHSQANLVTLCELCHDKLHAGTIEVGHMIQTSDGMERSVTTVTSNTMRKSKWSDEEIQQIQTVSEKFPKLSMANMCKYLLNQHNISISSVALKKLITG
jgi:DNA mismatch repair protein MutS